MLFDNITVEIPKRASYFIFITAIFKTFLWLLFISLYQFVTLIIISLLLLSFAVLDVYDLVEGAVASWCNPADSWC